MSTIEQMEAGANKRRQERNEAFDDIRKAARPHPQSAIVAAIKALAALYDVKLDAQSRPFAETPLSLGGR